LYGAHLEHWDLNGDPADRLAELLARVRAEAEAAMLLAAADAAGEEARQYYWSDDPDERHRDTIEDAVAKVVQALASSDAADALARRDAETRLDEADWWIKTFGLAGDVFDMANSRIAGLTSQLDEAKAPKVQMESKLKPKSSTVDLVPEPKTYL
jgi:hypothetical protein